MNISELLESNIIAQCQLDENRQEESVDETSSNTTNHDQQEQQDNTGTSLIKDLLMNDNSQFLTTSTNNESSESQIQHEMDQNEQNNSDNSYDHIAAVLEETASGNIDYSKMFYASNDYSSDMSGNNDGPVMSSDSDNAIIEDQIAFDSLNSFEKFCRLCKSGSPASLETASKFLVPSFEFCQCQDDFALLFYYLRKFCFYSDVVLRSLWLEQIQNIIQYLHQELDNINSLFQFADDFNMPQELALLINDLMREPAYQVKKCATTSLLFVLDKRLLDLNRIELLVIPSLLRLIEDGDEEFDTDCVSIFSKLAPLIGPDLTSKYLIKPFCNLSKSSVFHTRKACAANISELASVIDHEEVEKYLLDHFVEFVRDQVWAIRKQCADSFAQFASRCSTQTRQAILTDCFIKLLDDNSRWVKISAYKSLGPFIATFVQPKSDNQLEQSVALSQDKANQDAEADSKTDSEELVKQMSDEEKKDNEYSNFVYWRNTLPSLEDSLALVENSSSDVESKRESSSENLPKLVKSDEGGIKQITTTTNDNNSIVTLNDLLKTPSILDKINSSSSQTSIDVNTNYSSLSFTNDGHQTTGVVNHGFTQHFQQMHRPLQKTIEQLTCELNQDIVPSNLLSYFITMIDVNSQSSLDSEMNYNCAFNFPAIAYTLGPKYWHYLRDLYKKLAEDVSWKVRQTLAYSIHELALILGTEITQLDLVPVFDSYIKDVDEVRMGIVANLTKFLSVLNMDYKKSYMPKLNDFLKMDNQRNWRFRNELGQQIAMFCPQFPSACLADYVQPVAFTLALDKVAEVRITAVKSLVEILRQFEVEKAINLRRNFIEDTVRTFANSSKWSFRQLYAVLCEQVLSNNVLDSFETFRDELLPKLLSFRNDRVANIRVMLARVITKYLLNDASLASSPIGNQFDLTVQYLINDSDSDVRSYFCEFAAIIGSTSDMSLTQSDNETQMQQTPENGNLSMHTEPGSTISSRMLDFSSPDNTSSTTDERPATGFIELSDSSSSDDSSRDLNTTPVSQEQESSTKLSDEFNQEDDDDDSEDEIIDQTNLSQLRIVNLDEDCQAEEPAVTNTDNREIITEMSSKE